jgi:ankyrin repeat protein
VNVNARDYVETKSYSGKGITPLQRLCISGEDSPELAALLVEHGAEVNVARRRDNEVITALEDAAYFHKYKLVIYLLQHGARRSLRARDYLNHPDEVTPTVLKAWKLINGEPIDSMEEK